MRKIDGSPRVKKDRKDGSEELYIPELDPKLTGDAESVYEQMIDEEGFSEEQAFSIALTRLGKEGGDLDLEGDEDELNIHEPSEDEEPSR